LRKFTIISDVRQGCISHLCYYFALVIDWIMKNASMALGVGLKWAKGSHFDYTYNMVLLDT